MRILGSILALAVAASDFGAQVLPEADGVQSFAEQTPPAAPDYALASSWAAGPNGPGASNAVPAGATPAARHPKVDVFYIYPTTYLSKERWNQDIADPVVNAWTDASVIARQASIFNACCRVFAPRYRQASSLNKNGERMQALALAYGDVERAFDHYMRHDNHGRPFILAGHSQGGWIAAQLLEKRIDGTSAQAKLVAAYVIGMGVAEGDFPRRFKHLAICDTPAQTGCVVQWNAVLPSADVATTAARFEQTFVQTYGDIPAKTTLCVNPLTFDRSTPTAFATANLGAVPGEPNAAPIAPLLPHAVAARCEHGVLVVEPNAGLGLKPLAGGVMHYHDLGLFYADVRANAVLRAKTYLRGHSVRR